MSLKKLGRYELVRVIGKGAMGIVYEARDPNLDRRVAIKLVKVENLSEEAAAEYEARFRTEARSAARLQHPNIVSVYDSDRDGSDAFLVMEYIQGEDLKHYLDKGVRYSLEQSLRMIRDLLSALDYAHQQGIVHRDIKPANLLLEGSGRVKLTDFGVARIQDSGEATRTQGSMIGTLKYMAPEQVQGLKTDSRADLFSVGVVLYQLLTDKRPFDGDNDFSIIHQVIGHDPPPPSSINSGLPAAIDAVVARALAKDREQRFATARDFASALHSAIRRAEDATVIPPADPLKKTDAADPDSREQQSSLAGIATKPSVIAQEVELVYWKDIKESTEPEDFESFLKKFPAGIYADLARRRLRRLTGASTSPDQTVLTGVGKNDGDSQDWLRADMGSDAEPKREMDLAEATPGSESATPSTVADECTPSVAELESPEWPATVLGEAPDAESQTSGRMQPTLAPHKRPVAIWAGAGVLLVAGLAAFMLIGKRPGPSPIAPPQEAAVPAPVIAASAPGVQLSDPPVGASERVAVSASVAAPATVAASASVTTSPSVAASQRVAASASLPASAARVPASAGAPAFASVTAGDVKPLAGGSAAADSVSSKAVAPTKSASAGKDGTRPVPTATATPARQEARGAAAAAAASARAAQSEVEACRERFFVMREHCLAKACEKPGAGSHPLCVTWREEKRVREEGSARQSP